MITKDREKSFRLVPVKHVAPFSFKKCTTQLLGEKY